MAKQVSKSDLERIVETRLRQVFSYPFETEYRFHPKRMWRFDFAFVDQQVAVEVEGGTYGRVVYCHNCGEKVVRRLKDGRWVDVREGGRHNTGSGMDSDAEKYNAAAVLGWIVIRLTSTMVYEKETEWLDTLYDAFSYRIAHKKP